jgi:hypothetical protein
LLYLIIGSTNDSAIKQAKSIIDKYKALKDDANIYTSAINLCEEVLITTETAQKTFNNAVNDTLVKPMIKYYKDKQTKRRKLDEELNKLKTQLTNTTNDIAKERGACLKEHVELTKNAEEKDNGQGKGPEIHAKLVLKWRKQKDSTIKKFQTFEKNLEKARLLQSQFHQQHIPAKLQELETIERERLNYLHECLTKFQQLYDNFSMSMQQSQQLLSKVIPILSINKQLNSMFDKYTVTFGAPTPIIPIPYDLPCLHTDIANDNLSAGQGPYANDQPLIVGNPSIASNYSNNLQSFDEEIEGKQSNGYNNYQESDAQQQYNMPQPPPPRNNNSVAYSKPVPPSNNNAIASPRANIIQAVAAPPPPGPPGLVSSNSSSSNGPPMAPPPPIAPTTSFAPAPPKKAAATTSSSGNRSDLLSSIQAGKKLKKATTVVKGVEVGGAVVGSKPPPAAPSNSKPQPPTVSKPNPTHDDWDESDPSGRSPNPNNTSAISNNATNPKAAFAAQLAGMFGGGGGAGATSPKFGATNKTTTTSSSSSTNTSSTNRFVAPKAATNNNNNTVSLAKPPSTQQQQVQSAAPASYQSSFDSAGVTGLTAGDPPLFLASALFDFELANDPANDIQYIHFRAGDKINVYQAADDSEWWYVH